MLWFSTLDYAVDSLLPTCGHGIDVYEQMYTRPFFFDCRYRLLRGLGCAGRGWGLQGGEFVRITKHEIVVAEK